MKFVTAMLLKQIGDPTSAPATPTKPSLIFRVRAGAVSAAFSGSSPRAEAPAAIDDVFRKVRRSSQLFITRINISCIRLSVCDLAEDEIARQSSRLFLAPQAENHA